MGNGYVVAGYGLIWVSLLAYAWRIRRRLVVAERQLASTTKAPGAPGAAGTSQAARADDDGMHDVQR